MYHNLKIQHLLVKLQEQESYHKEQIKYGTTLKLRKRFENNFYLNHYCIALKYGKDIDRIPSAKTQIIHINVLTML